MSDSSAYRVGRVLGSGAISVVHEVIDQEGMVFAGKFLHASHQGDASATARSEQEARLLAGLDHPNLIKVFGPCHAQLDNGDVRRFIRMELVQGTRLDERIARRAPMAEKEIVALGLQMAEGLAFAHANGIVHRDLKPANMLLTDDTDNATLKIADFGMARASALSGVSGDGFTILGTPDYMAPESVDPLAVDTRTDLYAMGCILFEMATDAVPYSAATPLGILHEHRTAPIPDLPEAVTPQLAELIRALLAKNPADRPASAQVVIWRLKNLYHNAELSNRGSMAVPLTLRAPPCRVCHQQLISNLPVCLNCGTESIQLHPGRCAVLILGPGSAGDKLDSGLRERLRQWLRDNPQTGLKGGKWLEEHIPRVPFLFLNRVDVESASAVAAALKEIGFQTATWERHPMRHPAMQKKATKLLGRIGLVGLSSSVWAIRYLAAFWPISAIASLTAAGAVLNHCSRSVTVSSGNSHASLSVSLQHALNRIAEVAPSLRPRQREELRAVVTRSLLVRAQLGNTDTHDADVIACLDAALDTAVSLSEIDDRLRHLDLHHADDSTRALLQRRDRNAFVLSRILGALDELMLRLTISGSKNLDARASLAELKHQVDALEEVHRS
ncbi:MAG: serine/threonine-protein kinase [Deltaproteobacteria bacterium]|nr:serine/threonine-protein kinase [Deltaproteobacteria bacterium]